MKMIKISEASKMIGVCSTTLRQWDKDGILKAFRTPKGTRFYTEDQINNFLESCKQ